MITGPPYQPIAPADDTELPPGHGEFVEAGTIQTDARRAWELELAVLEHACADYEYSIMDGQYVADPCDRSTPGGRVTARSARDLLWRLTKADYLSTLR